MAIDTNATSGSLVHPIVTRHYGSFLTFGEQFNGIWEEEEGVAFIDREWPQRIRWQAPRREIEGFYNFYIQSKPHLQCGEFNGVPSRNYCRAGAVQFVQPNETVFTAGSGETRIFQVSISPSYLSSYLARNFVYPSGVDLETRQLDDLGLAILAQAHNDASKFGVSMRQLFFDQIREAILHRILVLFSSTRLQEKERAETLVPVKARIVVEYIDSNLTEDLRLQALAAIANLSRAHFARSFRKAMGMSPHLYVQHRRLNRAMDLLRSGDRTVKEIAALSGFADAAHLTRCFKLKFGCVPSRVPATDLASLNWCSAMSRAGLRLN
jgi:AraC-like DNA-binding protein